MTPQEIFDFVATHLFTQGQRAFLVDKNVCAYRDPQGLKCAVGCLIPNDEYSEAMEGSAVDDITDTESFSVWTENLLANNMELLGRLQSAHDYQKTGHRQIR